MTEQARFNELTHDTKWLSNNVSCSSTVQNKLRSGIFIKYDITENVMLLYLVKISKKCINYVLVTLLKMRLLEICAKIALSTRYECWR